MSRGPSFCAVILAAGESTRMGRDKALLPWPPLGGAQPASGQTLLSAAIQRLSSWNDMVFVVVGKNEANLAPVVYANGGEIVLNPAPERGQFSSLQVGLHEVLSRGRDAAMVTLVDRPPAEAATLQILRDAFAEAPPHIWAVIPEHAGRHGHPILIGREMIEAFLRAEPSATAREIQKQNQEHIQYVAVNDPWTAANLNTPEDYAQLPHSTQ